MDGSYLGGVFSWDLNDWMDVVWVEHLVQVHVHRGITFDMEYTGKSRLPCARPLVK